MKSFECILVLGAQKPGCTEAQVAKPTPKMMNTIQYIANLLYFILFISYPLFNPVTMSFDPM